MSTHILRQIFFHSLSYDCLRFDDEKKWCETTEFESILTHDQQQISKLFDTQNLVKNNIVEKEKNRSALFSFHGRFFRLFIVNEKHC